MRTCQLAAPLYCMEKRVHGPSLPCAREALLGPLLKMNQHSLNSETVIINKPEPKCSKVLPFLVFSKAGIAYKSWWLLLLPLPYTKFWRPLPTFLFHSQDPLLWIPAGVPRLTWLNLGFGRQIVWPTVDPETGRTGCQLYNPAALLQGQLIFCISVFSKISIFPGFWWELAIHESNSVSDTSPICTL